MHAIRTITRAAALALLLPAGAAWALNVCPGWNDPLPLGEARHEVFVSPHTHHWTPDPEHERVVAISLSRRLPNDRTCGISLFTNSFGQPSAYVFAAKTWAGAIRGWPQVYVSASAGIIYGYVGQYKNKVPLNVGGFSPVVVPALGYRLSDRTALELQLLGNAALMFGATWRY